MQSIRILFLIFLLFQLSISINEIKNTFTIGNQYSSHCQKSNGKVLESYIIFKGSWENKESQNIPSDLKFELQLDDEQKINCSINEEIRCDNVIGTYELIFSDQLIGENNEYLIKAFINGMKYSCIDDPSPSDSSHSFVRSSYLVLLLLISILF